MLYDPRRRAPASGHDFLGAISLGCLLENMWLMAESLGIAVHVVSGLAGGGTEREIKRILHIPSRRRIAFSVRLGYPKSPGRYLRVRREAGDFVHRNVY